MPDKDYLTPAQFIRLERETLSYLRTSKLVAERFPSLAAGANAAFAQRDSAPRFDFFAELATQFEGVDRCVVNFGECVVTDKKNKGRYDKISSFVIFWRQDDAAKRVLRKFHFDYHPTSKGDRTKPTFHTQYAGEIPPQLVNLRLDLSHLDTWFEQPRISHRPMSISLLLDIIFCEATGCPSCRTIREDSAWRKLVATNEKALLSTFLKRCLDRVNSAENRPLSDFLYANP